VTDLSSHLKNVIVAKRMLRRGESAVVAVSGGVDSMVQLHLLHALTQEFGWKLSVAHFNHQLRGRASEADERLVRAAARQLKLPCDMGRAKVREHARRTGVSVEMAARELRHTFFARCARKRKAQVIVLAQHANDQVELFLMRLLRGSSGDGLGGMKWSSCSPADKRVRLVRPLLDCWKEQLIAHAKVEQISYREDASNASAEFERNWVRQTLLPVISKRHPAALRTLRRTMMLVQEESELIAGVARQWMDGRSGEPFQSLPAALQRRIIQGQLIELGVVPDFGCIELLRENLGQPVSVSPELRLICDSNGRVSHLVEAPGRFSDNQTRVSLDGGKTTRRGIKFEGLKVTCSIRPRHKVGLSKPRAGVEVFDADRIGKTFTLGHWQPGDRFQPIGMATAVKLQDWFTNRKIPAERRHQLVLAKTEHGEVFWVEGERIGEVAKVTPKTRRTLEWRWKRA